ncbi:MAG: hypothetical protein KDA41_22335, partial [Planctomycetales bacterium]|nr:hypothetical protein [Planctomycetales bacterium]
AQRARPALCWRGRFIDAHATWYDRFQPPAVPLSKDALALADAQTPTLVDGTGRALVPQFAGYTLYAQGAPTFLFTAGGREFTDRLQPTSDGRGLARRITVAGRGGPLALVVAAADDITESKPGHYQIDKRWSVDVAQAHAERFRSASGRLTIAIPAGDQPLTIDMECRWP